MKGLCEHKDKKKGSNILEGLGGGGRMGQLSFSPHLILEESFS